MATQQTRCILSQRAEARMTLVIVLPLLAMGCSIWHSLVFGSSPKLHSLAKMTESGLAVTSASSLSTLREIPSGSMDL